MSPRGGWGLDHAGPCELQGTPCLNFILVVIENHWMVLGKIMISDFSFQNFMLSAK